MKNSKVKRKQQVRSQKKQDKKQREKDKILQLKERMIQIKIEQEHKKELLKRKDEIMARYRQEEKEKQDEEQLGFQPNALGEFMLRTMFSIPDMFVYGNKPSHNNETPKPDVKKIEKVEEEDEKEDDPFIIEGEFKEL